MKLQMKEWSEKDTEHKPNIFLYGGLGEKVSNGGTQYYQQDRVYSSQGFAMCHPANIPGGSYKYLVIVDAD